MKNKYHLKGVDRKQIRKERNRPIPINLMLVHEKEQGDSNDCVKSETSRRSKTKQT